jgi:hypothetical protein
MLSHGLSADTIKSQPWIGVDPVYVVGGQGSWFSMYYTDNDFDGLQEFYGSTDRVLNTLWRATLLNAANKNVIGQKTEWEVAIHGKEEFNEDCFNAVLEFEDDEPRHDFLLTDHAVAL